MMKRISLLILFIAVSVTIFAQQDVLSVEFTDRKPNASLNGKAAVVFRAESDDYVITSSVNEECQSIRRVGDSYEYSMTIDLRGHSSESRVFIVKKRGTPFEGKSPQKDILANNISTYVISEIKNKIGGNEQINAHTFFDEKGNSPVLACIEVSVPQELGLSVNVSPALKANVTDSSSAGNKIYKIVYDTRRFSELSKIVEDLKRQKGEIDDKIEKTTDEKEKKLLWDQQDLFEAKVDTAEANLTNASIITIEGKDVNTLTIDPDKIIKLTPRDKLIYGVVVVEKEVTKVVVETQYGELLRQADSEFQDRQYARAAEIYRLAANEKGINAEQRNIALTKVTTSLRYDTIQTNAEKYAKLINDIVGKKQDVKKDLLIKAFDQAILAFRSLSNSTGDPYFKEKMEKLIAEKEKIGIILEGNTFYSELHQGLAEESPLGNCKFYGVKGSVSDDIRSNIYWKNDQELATSASDGSFKFQVKANQYDFIVVVGAHNGKIKANKVIPMKGRGDSKLKIVFGKK